MAGLGRRSHYRKHLTDSVLNDYPEPDSSEGERLARVVGTRGSNQFEIILSLADPSSFPSSSSSAAVQSTSTAIGGESKRLPKLAILPTKFRKLVWVKRNDFVIVRCGDDEEDERATDGDGDAGDKYVGSTDNDDEEDNDNDNPSTSTGEGGGEREEEVVECCASSRLPQRTSTMNGNGADAYVSSSASAGPDESMGGIRYEISRILYKDQIKHLKRKGLWPSKDPYFKEDGVSVGADGGVSVEVAATGEDEISTAPTSFTKLVDKESKKSRYDDDYDGIVYDDNMLFMNTNKISALRVLDSESDDSESDSS